MARIATNKFGSENLYCWSKFINNISIDNINDPLSEALWNNPMVSKTQLFLPHWYNKGIISISDMIYENGNYISQNNFKMVYHISLFIYLGFYVTFNPVQVISRRVVPRAEETSTYSSLGFCTVNCQPAASNYQLSHLRLF